jgi:hypothetical protein
MHRLSVQEEGAVKELIAGFFPSRPAWQVISRSVGIVIELGRGDQPLIFKVNLSAGDDTAELQARLDCLAKIVRNDSSDQKR